MVLPTAGVDGFGPVGPWTGGPGPVGPGPVGPGPVAGAWGPGPVGVGYCPSGCHTVYGPVANVCHGAVPQVNLIPTTSISPIYNPISPAFGYGKPVPVDGPYPPYYGGYGGYGGYGSPISFYGSGAGPWGGSYGGTGFAPGIYTSDVSVLGAW